MTRLNSLLTTSSRSKQKIASFLALGIVVLTIAILGLLSYQAIYNDYRKAESRYLDMVFEKGSRTIVQKYSIYGDGYYNTEYINREIDEFRKENKLHVVYLTNAEKLIVSGDENIKIGVLSQSPLFLKIKPVSDDTKKDAPIAYIVAVYRSQALADLQAGALSVFVVFLALSMFAALMIYWWLRAKDENAEKEQMMINQARFAEMGSMLSNIAHQWKQPLSSIGSAVIQIDYDSLQLCRTDKEIQILLDQTNTIRGQLKYLSSTIDTFKNFLQAKPATAINFSLDTVLNDVAVLLAYELKSNNIKVYRPNHTSLQAYGSPDQLLQALLIIFQNAIDAMKDVKDSEKVITVECHEIRNFITLCVRDNGPGIGDKEMRHIFDAYFTTKHKDRGTGLGLYIAKSIIEFKFKGVLRAQNHPGGGAEFIISLSSSDDRPLKA